MQSIQIMTAYKILELTSVEVTDTFLRVRGDDFSATKFCVVNGHTTTEFAISARTLLIYPPASIDPRDVKNVTAVAESTTVDNATLLQLGFGYDVRSVEGVMRLVQLFVFTLLSTPGTYILNRNIGGGVIELIKRGAGAAPDKILPDLVAAIRKTEDDIIGMQAGLKLPADELLLSVEVLSTTVNPSDSSVTAFVELVTLNGLRRAFNVGI